MPSPKFFKSGCDKLAEAVPEYRKLLIVLPEDRAFWEEKSYVAPVGNLPLRLRLGWSCRLVKAVDVSPLVKTRVGSGGLVVSV
jgi:hypothetical protein